MVDRRLHVVTDLDMVTDQPAALEDGVDLGDFQQRTNFEIGERIGSNGRQFLGGSVELSRCADVLSPLPQLRALFTLESV